MNSGKWLEQEHDGAIASNCLIGVTHVGVGWGLLGAGLAAQGDWLHGQGRNARRLPSTGHFQASANLAYARCVASLLLDGGPQQPDPMHRSQAENDAATATAVAAAAA